MRDSTRRLVMPGLCLSLVRLNLLMTTLFRRILILICGHSHFKALPATYPASVPNLLPSLVLFLNKIIWQLTRWDIVFYTLFYSVFALALLRNDADVIIRPCWAYILVFSLCFFRFLFCSESYYSYLRLFLFRRSTGNIYSRIRNIGQFGPTFHLSKSQLAHNRITIRSFHPVFSGQHCLSIDRTDNLCTSATRDQSLAMLELINPSGYQQQQHDHVMNISGTYPLEETTDDFGAGDCDSNASVPMSINSMTKRSIHSHQRSMHKRSNGLLTSTIKSEAKWIELELERYPKVAPVLDEEDSLDNRDTDKVVSMRSNKTTTRNSLEPNMAGTGAGALSKDHILALNGKVVIVNSLANIIMTPEQAEKAIKAKTKLLKSRDSQKDCYACNGSCSTHLSLPYQRYLEYMMSTDDLGEVVFTPYLGVGVPHKHLQMPPLRVFVVGSKAGSSKRSGKAVRNRKDASSKRSESRLNSASSLSHSLSQIDASEKPLNARSITQSPSKLQMRELNETESRPTGTIDKVMFLAPSLLTASNKKHELLHMSSTVAYARDKSSEWSDPEEDMVKHRHKRVNNKRDVDKLKNHKGDVQTSSKEPSIKMAEDKNEYDSSNNNWNDLPT